MTTEWISTPAGNGTLVACTESGATLTFRDVLDRWTHDTAFTARYASALANTALDAFFWETPPLTVSRLSRPFECMLLPAPGLARRAPDESAFAQQLTGCPTGTLVLSFPNLGGDANLIVPCRIEGPDVYTHMARFCRGAPQEQQLALWQRVGQDVLAQVGEAPIWVSTSGLGVSWLHVRIDRRPKYYSHRPYRTWPPG